jgi:hypothetical protein
MKDLGAVIIEGDRAANRHSAAPDKCFLDMLGVFAESETHLGKQRQLALRNMAGTTRVSPQLAVRARASHQRFVG